MTFYRNMVNMGKKALKPVVGTLMFIGGVLTLVACDRSNRDQPEDPKPDPKRNISMTIPADVAKHQQFRNAVGDSSMNPQIEGITLKQPAGGWPTKDIPESGNMVDGYGFRGAVAVNPDMIRLGGDFTFNRIYIGDSTWIANNGGNVITINGTTPYREPPVQPGAENRTVPLTWANIGTNSLTTTIDSLTQLRQLYSIDTLFIVFPCRWAGRPSAAVTGGIYRLERVLEGVPGTNYGTEYVEPDAMSSYSESRLNAIRIAVGGNTHIY